MNFVESLGLSSGLKVSRPSIQESFFPIVPDRYITFHTENHQSKQWDHFQEWINLIKPYLDKKGIALVELGWNEVKFSGQNSALKNIDPKHAAYILRHSLLHVGPENFLIQLASFYKKPLVALFSNTPIDYARPLWGDHDDKQKNRECLIEAPRMGTKPSFANEEHPKSINAISAEEVASRTLDLLGIPNGIDSVIPFYIGDIYHTACVEVVPDFAPDANFFPRSLVNVRLDYDFNEQLLTAIASNRKVSLISDKKINLNLIRQISPNIEAFFFKIDEDFDLDYLKAIQRLGKPITTLSKPSCNLSATRLKFFDWKIEEEVIKEKKDLDNHEEICDTTRYKSTKMLFSKGKQYSSKAAWDQQVETHENQMVLDCPDFWSESHHFKLYNIND